MLRESLFPFTTLLVIALDQISKFWVRSALSTGQFFPDEGILRLTHITNSGTVFGFLASPFFSLAFSVLALLAILFLCYYYVVSFHSFWGRIALGLMLGGGLGNLLDRLRFGYVIDFIDVRLYPDWHWPTFNLADLALLCGVIVLVYLLLSSPEKRGGWGHKETKL